MCYSAWVLSLPAFTEATVPKVTPVRPSTTAQGTIQVQLRDYELPRDEWPKLQTTISLLGNVTSVELVRDNATGSKSHLVIQTQCGQLSGAKLEATFNKVVQQVTSIVDHKVAVTL